MKNAKKNFFNKTFFLNRKKILTPWYFANQSGIMWFKFNENEKKKIFLGLSHLPLQACVSQTVNNFLYKSVHIR